MFFSRKKSNQVKCGKCNSRISEKFNFCPFCGGSMLDEEEEMEEFGMLGKNDFTGRNTKNNSPIQGELGSLGITDKLIGSIMNSMMRNLDKQFKNMQNAGPEDMASMEGAHIEQIPNGIKIRIGMPHQVSPQGQRQKQIPKKQITEAQLERMSKLPRAEAKTKIRRLSDKVVYELETRGIESPEDIFISKLESGYEIKAIGKNKVYVNSIPISLPLKGFSFDDKKLSVEFITEK